MRRLAVNRRWFRLDGNFAFVADNLVLSVLHKGEIKPKDFSESLGAYSLSVGRKTFPL